MADSIELIPLGIEHLTVSGMPPAEFVELAARADLQSVSLWSALADNPFGFAPWSLIDDAALRRAVRERLAATGIRLALGEAWVLRQGVDASGSKPMIEAFADLGCRAINMVSFETDRAREIEQAHKFAELVSEAGMAVAWEFAGNCQVTLAEAAEEIRRMRAAGQDAELLIDPMHFGRRGLRAEALAAIAPDLIGYFQICDVPLVGKGSYMDEALHRRLPPGDGELPLHEIIRALPDDVTCSMEIPQVARAQAGESHFDLVLDAAGKCRRLIATARQSCGDL